VAVTIRATVPGTRVPGSVRISYAGHRLHSAKLSHGRASVALPARSKGRYRLTVTYPGATGFDSRTVRVTVVVR